ncbi:MAG: YhbY family RNA-binding protein [Lachnospiraceae bacterium]|nr:YhbY family RNA-binding protein [Lachnospiraceae bacterium]
MTSKQRSYLIGLAADITPTLQIGKAGAGPEATASLEEGFNTRELIKVSILKTSPDEPAVAADKLAERTHAQVIKVIGRKAVLYRPFKENPVIVLPK